MRVLTQSDLNNVYGASAWDDFWYSLGSATANLFADQVYSGHTQSVYNQAKTGNDEAIRAAYPNDPLL